MIIRLTDRPDHTKSFAEVSYPLALGETLIYQSAVSTYYYDDPQVISTPATFIYYMPKNLQKITRYDTIRRFSAFTFDSTQKEIGVFLVDGEYLNNLFPTFLSQGYIPLSSMSQLSQYALYTFYLGRFYDRLNVEMYNRPLRQIFNNARPSITLQGYSILGTIGLSQYVASNLMIIFAMRPVTTVPFPFVVNGINYQGISLNVELNETYLTRETDVSEAKFFARLYKPINVNLP